MCTWCRYSSTRRTSMAYLSRERPCDTDMSGAGAPRHAGYFMKALCSSQYWKKIVDHRARMDVRSVLL